MTDWKPRRDLVRFGFWKDLRVCCSGEKGLEGVAEADWQGGGFNGPAGMEVHQPKAPAVWLRATQFPSLGLSPLIWKVGGGVS